MQARKQHPLYVCLQVPKGNDTYIYGSYPSVQRLFGPGALGSPVARQERAARSERCALVQSWAVRRLLCARPLRRLRRSANQVAALPFARCVCLSFTSLKVIMASGHVTCDRFVR